LSSLVVSDRLAERASVAGLGAVHCVGELADEIVAHFGLDDLRVPPGNRLEALKGGRTGQHSIRINQRWRICFVWTAAGPEGVEIVDYH